eukprot:10248882-Ditylum_brightwellii.AAC.1
MNTCALQNVAVPKGTQGNVILHPHIIGSVQHVASMIRNPHNIPRYDGPINVATHVKVDQILSQDALLAKIAYLQSRDDLYNGGVKETNRCCPTMGLVS